MATGKKKQNVFADDEELQPNDAFNRAVEAARNATSPKTETPIGDAEAPSTTLPKPEAGRDDTSKGVNEAMPAPVAPAPTTQQTQVPPLPVSQPAVKPENQKADRAGAGYTKATHRIRDDAFQALEDMKLILKRQYGFKRILLEEIVEEAILGIKHDLDQHKGQSILVQRLREQKQSENL